MLFRSSKVYPTTYTYPTQEGSSPPPPPPETATKKVEFKPEALVFDFPNERYRKPKSSNNPLDLAKQILKGTADMILPPNPPQTPRTYDDRPIKTARNYDELMAEFPTGTRPKMRTGPPPPHELDQTFQYPDNPDETIPAAQPHEETGPSSATRSQHPQLQPGIP